MGEPVTVIEMPSNRAGYVRYETNRSFTGMGHESYRVDEEVYGSRPPDEIAKALFATGKASEVHVYAQTVTVKLRKSDAIGLKEVLENLYIFYKPGVDVPTPESFASEA